MAEGKIRELYAIGIALLPQCIDAIFDAHKLARIL
jgi:hypothetical protein